MQAARNWRERHWASGVGYSLSGILLFHAQDQWPNPQLRMVHFNLPGVFMTNSTNKIKTFTVGTANEPYRSLGSSRWGKNHMFLPLSSSLQELSMETILTARWRSPIPGEHFKHAVVECWYDFFRNFAFRTWMTVAVTFSSLSGCV